ncbi:hypothetical protein PIB30_075350 [Stylosanthes scabra]|uniref:Uncharacterized protein n=1 Tax=Stylosanthes scabra TaxID=79078 RepID=A0ABU6YQ90_9FABA|nr:hypothetical protein [Stylosanthes scabra]
MNKLVISKRASPQLTQSLQDKESIAHRGDAAADGATYYEPLRSRSSSGGVGLSSTAQAPLPPRSPPQQPDCLSADDDDNYEDA